MQSGNIIRFEIMDAAGNKVCEIEDGTLDCQTRVERNRIAAQDEAKARLLCASPDLLAALEPLVRLYAGQITNTGEYYPQLLDAARQAIARATQG